MLRRLSPFPPEIGDGGGVFREQIFLAIGSGDLSGGECDDE